MKLVISCYYGSAKPGDVVDVEEAEATRLKGLGVAADAPLAMVASTEEAERLAAEEAERLAAEEAERLAAEEAASVAKSKKA